MAAAERSWSSTSVVDVQDGDVELGVVVDGDAHLEAEGVDRLGDASVDLVAVSGEGEQVQPALVVEQPQHAAGQHLVGRGPHPVAHRRVELALEPHELQPAPDLALPVRLDDRTPERTRPIVRGSAPSTGRSSIGQAPVGPSSSGRGRWRTSMRVRPPPCTRRRTPGTACATAAAQRRDDEGTITEHGGASTRTAVGDVREP